MLQSGSVAKLEILTDEVVGFVSDQGVEHELRDACFAHSRLTDIGKFRNLVFSIRSGEYDLACEKTKRTFLFPHAKGISDAGHILFGAFQSLFEKGEAFSDFFNAVSAISKLLVHSGLRSRFARRCIRDPRERAISMQYPREALGWEWESMSRFLGKLLRLLPIMQRTFDAEAIRLRIGWHRESRSCQNSRVRSSSSLSHA